MNIRFYRPDDLSELERMHRAMGFEYEMPNLADPLFFIKMVGEDKGKIVNAAVAHLTAEIYFLADPEAGTPRERHNRFLALHEAGCEVAYRQGGVSDLHCWIPPGIEKSFGRRLRRLGWVKPLWPCFMKELKKEG